MDKLTPQQKKACIIVGIVILSYYLLQSFMESTAQAGRMYQQQARQAEQRQQQQKNNTDPNLPGVPMNKFLGVWEAKTFIEGRGTGNCNVKAELRKHNDLYVTYFTLTCAGPPRAPISGGESAIFRGKSEDRAIKLKAEKVVDNAFNCPPTDLTLTMFGNQLAGEWQETNCTGGHAILTRTKP